MNFELLLDLCQYMAIILLASLVIMQGCNVFEPAASYLGRNLSGGARGGILDAIASSLPETFVTLMFVASGKPELILAGVAVTAGSAMFNSTLIPALSIYAAKDKEGRKVHSFAIYRPSLVRDGFYLLALEGVLIYFLGLDTFTLMMGGILLTGYVIYVVHTMIDSYRLGSDEDEYEFESLESNWLQAIYRFDFNKILFGDKPFTKTSAWIVLGLSVVVVGVACHWLTVGIEGVAVTLNVPVYFSAVVLGAAATSIPDTILSVKSAQRGDYEDAVSNAIGSNIFDITVSLALPICIYLLLLSDVAGLPIVQSEDLIYLRWFVLVTSALVVLAMVATAKNMSRKTANFLIGLYAVWFIFILVSAITF